MAAPLPVLLLVRELNLGGCERDLTKLALRLDRTWFQPHVACFRPEGLRRVELEAAGVPVLHLPVTSFASPSVLRGGWELVNYVRRHGIRLVHAFDVPLSVFTPPWARLAGVPAVISSQLSYRSLAQRRFQAGLRVSDRLSHRVVVNCRAMWEHMAGDEGCPEQKLFLSYNGVDTEVFYAGPEQRPVELAGAHPVIGSVCALRPEKRLDLLLGAYARVRELAPESKLAIVGSGTELEALQALTKALGLNGHVVFQPATPAVAKWLRSIDIFVLASDSEAFSNALLEAMACGCCPLGSRVGGTPELITEGECGLLFAAGDETDLADRLAGLLRDPMQRAHLAKNAAIRAREEFSLEAAVERMSAFYRELLRDRLRR